MRSKRTFVIFAIVLFLAAGLFLRDKFNIAVGETSGRIGSIFSSPLALIASVTGAPSLKSDLAELSLENAMLRGKLALLETHATMKNSFTAIEAHVFSTYPFNHRNILMIDKGSDALIEVGTGVTIGDALLLGKVTQVFAHTSSVKTIFDPDITLPVKIGTEEINALLVGGRIPQLTLIDKNADIVSGDVVYSAGNGFPYGLSVGTVGKLVPSAGAAFQEATLEIGYDAGTVDMVSVLIP